MSTLERVTAKTQVIPTYEIRKYLVVDHDDDNILLDRLAMVAQDMLEPPDGWLGRALARADFKLSMSDFEDEIKLPAPPFSLIKTFEYRDTTDGSLQTVDASLYEVVERNIAVIRLLDGKTWPDVGDYLDAVQITYESGYETYDDVPEAIRMYMLYQISQMYDLRSPLLMGQFQENKFVKHMLESWRVRL